MKKRILVIIIISFTLFYSNAHAQEKRAPAVNQGRFAELIGEKLGYKEAPIENLKKIGVTPLGEWSPEKPLTTQDLDAILIRLARRDPVMEHMEPAKLVDSIGFPSRDVSQEAIKTMIESEVFKRTTINLRLLLSGAALPLPVKYFKAVEIGEGGMKSDIAVATSATPVAAVAAPAVANPTEEPPPVVEPPPPAPEPTPKPSW